MDQGAAFLKRLERACQTWNEVNPQELAQLVWDVRRVPTSDQFTVLAQAFTDDHYLKQEYAGRILIQLNPPCGESLDDLLPRLLPGWNRSVEQLPRYLARAFGRDHVLAALDAIDSNLVPGDSKTNMVRYWLRVFPDVGAPDR